MGQDFLDIQYKRLPYVAYTEHFFSIASYYSGIFYTVGVASRTADAPTLDFIDHSHSHYVA